MSIRKIGSLAILTLAASGALAEPRCVSGVYPSLGYFNREGECGTGAVVPWAGSLWVVTYGPHCPTTSSDRLYQITEDLELIVRPESIGGTCANRMIHEESQQLFIGRHVIDAQGNVRTIPPMLKNEATGKNDKLNLAGRPTANMRHLFDPANKVYCATMEEGFYEVDVKTLAVREIFRDGNYSKRKFHQLMLPGYHGKGAYTAQNRLVYANNGEYTPLAMGNPRTTAGVLAQWDGKSEDEKAWEIVLRNQFTEVTGPDGIAGGNKDPDSPLWSLGWDYRSVMLMCLDHGTWYKFRLPKGSHSYDGAHGWNTEWPRIRDVGAEKNLMTMHGTFWWFPKTFDAAHTAGIEPLSNYLKVIGDFCGWKSRVVFGCDDSAKSEFMNKRAAKGGKKGIHGTQLSNSNLWFVDPARLASFGPLLGRGSVWEADAVTNGVPSDPYLFAGYDRRTLYLSADSETRFDIEINDGTKPLTGGDWKKLNTLTARPGVATEFHFDRATKGAWVRLVPQGAATNVFACFQYANDDARSEKPAEKFFGIAKADAKNVIGGAVYSSARDTKNPTGKGYVKEILGIYFNETHEFTIDKSLAFTRTANTNLTFSKSQCDFRGEGFGQDERSAYYTEFDIKRRLPVAAPLESAPHRVCREVSTERDLFNLCGTFYELPAQNAGGFNKIRAMSTHASAIRDYGSCRGLIFLTGLDADLLAAAKEKNAEHILVADDGVTAVWTGVIDDLWDFGKPRGVGGPWKETAVKAGEASDSYLLCGFDKKELTLAQKGAPTAQVTIEIDLTGEGAWRTYRVVEVKEGAEQTLTLDSLRGYWIRFRSDVACTATAWLVYK